MKNNLMAMAVAAAMQTMQRVPESLRTVDHRITGGNGFNPHAAKNKSFRRKSVSKYESHQGKQECARRLRVYSPAWHSANCMERVIEDE